MSQLFEYQIVYPCRYSTETAIKDMEIDTIIAISDKAALDTVSKGAKIIFKCPLKG